MSNGNAKLDLIVAKMEEAKRHHTAMLNKAIFAVGAPSRPVPPPTRRQRLWRKWLRVRGYFSTLWLALCGRDLVEADDYDW
jgi:hypothetical protein